MTFLHSESVLASEKGVPMAVARMRRAAMIEGVDWVMKDGDVMLTEQAASYIFDGITLAQAGESGVQGAATDEPALPASYVLVSEEAYSLRVGLHRKELRHQRKLLKLETEKTAAGAVMLNWEQASAIAKGLGLAADFALGAFLSAGEGVDPTVPEKTPPASNGAVLASVGHAVVVQSRLKNRHILLCELVDEEKTSVRVRVSNNAAFRIGMKIPVRQVSGTYYEFTGRMPRSRRSYFS